MKKCDYGICKVSIAPVRSRAADEAEMVTQLLFGDFVKILEYGEPWIKIEFPFDDYQGWMDFKQIEFISEETYIKEVNSEHKLVTTDLLEIDSDVGKMRLILGSNLPGLRGKSGKFGDFNYSVQNEMNAINESIVETAKRYLNAPYLWGGKGLFGVDCSGFTQIVAKLHGHRIPRDCSQQIDCGEEINFSDRKKGDFVFFINKNDHIHHIGIALNDQDIIHASGQVRIDKYDELGIFRKDMNKHTHKFHSIRRL